MVEGEQNVKVVQDAAINSEQISKLNKIAADYSMSVYVSRFSYTFNFSFKKRFALNKTHYYYWFIIA